MMTETQTRRRLEIFQAMWEEIENIIYSLPGIGDITSWEINGDMIEICYEDYHCSCCSPDYGSISIPISYLWTENWRELHDERLAAEKKEAERIKKMKETKAKKAAEESRRKQYEKLKGEFENGLDKNKHTSRNDKV